MSVFEDIKKLNWSPDQYVVVGGAALAARGIRESRDIDCLVTKELEDNLRSEGWKEKTVGESLVVFQMGEYEAGQHMLTTETYRPNPEQIFARAEYINGVPFISLPDLVDFKKNKGREKDIRDVELIEKYLSR